MQSSAQRQRGPDRHRLRLLILGPVLLLIVACNEQTLYSDLSEQEANEMVALLYNAGLQATKVPSSDQQFTVSTLQKEFAQAVGLLQTNGLPRARFDSIGDVFAREGFVSSPLEERARLNYALSQELSQTLSTIEGVVGVRVHLAVPEHDPLKDDIPESSASVLVKHRAEVDLAPMVAQMKALVVDGVENVPYENVTVMLVAADPSRWPDAKAVSGIEKVGRPSDTLLMSLGIAANPTSLALMALLAVCFAGIGWLGARTANVFRRSASTPAKQGARSLDRERESHD